MADFSRSIDYGSSFLSAVRGEDDSALDEATQRVGGPQGVILASSLLAVFVREALGSSITLEDVAAYAKKMSSDLANGPRRIALEDVLRTGAGFDKILSGLDDDERLVATAAILRYVSGDLERRSIPVEPLIERAVQLAVTQHQLLPFTD